MAALRSILVPVDGSSPSFAALDHAVALAEDRDASITVLRVIPAVSSVISPARGEADPLIEAAVQKAEGVLGSRISLRTVVGDPTEEIIHAARTGFDLIVMGTHGRIGRLHAMIGSVAEGVVRNAPCPVLTVRDPDGGYQSFAESRHHRPTLNEQR